MTTKGGCLCGAVRYEISGEPAFAAKCYCTECQKETGSGHLAFVAYPDENVVFSGEVQTYDRQGDSGDTVTRTFCPNCGTTLRGQPRLRMPGMSVMRAGTLDESDGLDMQRAVFCKSARSWDQPPDGLTHFPGLPTESR